MTRTEKFEMELYFFKSFKPKVSVSRRSFAKENLNLFGIVPLLRDKFTMRVIIVAILSIQ